MEGGYIGLIWNDLYWWKTDEIKTTGGEKGDINKKGKAI